MNHRAALNLTMTEIWSGPWHALQRSLANELEPRLPKNSAPSAFTIDAAVAVNSWLVRALRGDGGAGPTLAVAAER